MENDTNQRKSIQSGDDKASVDPFIKNLIEFREGLKSGEKEIKDFVSYVKKSSGLFNTAKQRLLEHRDSRKEELNSLLKAHADYDRGIALLNRYQESRDAGDIDSGIEILSKALKDIKKHMSYFSGASAEAEEAEHVFVNRLRKMAVEGADPEDEKPFESPYLVNLAKLGTDLLEQRMNHRDFEEHVEKHKSLFLQGKKEIEERYSEETPKLRKLLRAYDEHNEGLDRMKEYLESGDRQCIDDGFDKVSRAVRIIKKGLSGLYEERVTSGPTKSPHANLLIHACRNRLENTIDDQALREALMHFSSAADKFTRDMERAAGETHHSIPILEELPKLMECTDMYGEAISEIEEFLNDKASERLGRAEELLEKGTEVLNASMELLQSLKEKEGSVSCPKCQTLNTQGRLKCSNCNTVLPQLTDGDGGFEVREGEAETADPDEMMLTSNLKRLYDAIKAISEDRIDDAEYLGTLAWMRGVLKEAEAELARQPFINPFEYPEEEREQMKADSEIVEDAKALFRKGIGDFGSGLDLLETYVQSRNQDILKEGIERTYSAARIIYQVQIAGEMAQQKIRESAEGS